MTVPAKLVADLTLVLRGVRTHEGVASSHLGQARSSAVEKHLREVAAREGVVADRVARALRGLGAPAPRTRPSWLPSPTAVVATAVTTAQPLGEALLVEAATVRTLADRARLVAGLADSIGDRSVTGVAEQVVDLYDDYADWLVRTATAVVVNPDTADLVATTVQRIAGQAKVVIGAPARLYGQAADRAAAGVDEAADQVRRLLGRGTEQVEDAARTATDTVAGAVVDAAEAVEDAVTPLQASDLPVTRYDSRSATEAVQAVRGLRTVKDVSTVVAYEAQHKDRKTVIEAGERRVSQLADA